jgi:hypothetical protein
MSFGRAIAKVRRSAQSETQKSRICSDSYSIPIKQLPCQTSGGIVQVVFSAMLRRPLGLPQQENSRAGALPSKPKDLPKDLWGLTLDPIGGSRRVMGHVEVPR